MKILTPKIDQRVKYMILDLIVKNPNQSYHTEELTRRTVKQYGKEYSDGFQVIMILDQLFSQRLVKRVAASTFQSINGADDWLSLSQKQ